MYSFDAGGSQTTKTEVTEDETKVTTYGYDFNSKLTDVSLPNGKKVSYSYDGLGNRTARTLTRPDGKTEATEYLNDLSNPLVQVLQATGDKETLTYLYGLQRISVTSERPGKQNPKPDTDYYLYDGLGSVKALVDSHGNQVARYSYDEWGVPDPSTHFKGSGHPNTFGFTGEDWDPDAELLYLRARYYEPMVGRFTSPDPLGRAAVSSPRINQAYAYANSNPLTWVDPMGLLSESGRRIKIQGFAQQQRELVLSESIADLEAMARIADYAASLSTSASEFVDDLGLVLASRYGMLGNADASYFVEFADTGFAQRYLDPNRGGNQVRHYVGFMVAGFYAERTAGTGVLAYNEVFGAPSWGDFLLGEAGLSLGIGLKWGVLGLGLQPAGVGSWMREALSS